MQYRSQMYFYSDNPTFEGQVYKTINDYETFLVDEDNILDEILGKFTEEE